MNEQLHKPRNEFTVRPVLPIIAFTDYIVPKPNPATQEINEYERLIETPIMPIKIRDYSSDRVTYAGVTVPLKGMEINALTHFGAPNKSFGRDTQDYLNDRHDLFNPTSEYDRRRLENHRGIPNWDIFEKIEGRVTQAIAEDFGKTKIEHPLKLTPIIQLTKKEGKLAVDFVIHPDLLAHLDYTGTWPDLPPIETYLPELGPLVLAAYSPDITSTWKTFDSYGGDCQAQNRKQRIAATQLIAYSLWKADDLIQGRFASNLIHYCETGTLLTAPSSSTTEEDIRPYPADPNSFSGFVDTIWE